MSRAEAVHSDEKPIKTILVVDDDELIRRSINAALQFAGYAVLLAENGQEGIRLCNEHDGPIDLVLTDLMMPDSNGLSVVDMLNDRRPDTKVVLTSGVISREMLLPEDQQRPHAFLGKPFSTSDLLRVIGELLPA